MSSLGIERPSLTEFVDATVMLDLDGISYRRRGGRLWQATLPLGTIAKFLDGTASPTPPDEHDLVPAHEMTGFSRWFSNLRHTGREVHPLLLDLMAGTQQLADSRGKKVRFIVASGREPHLHDFTRDRLTADGITQFVSPDDINLCKVKSGSAHKLMVARKELKRSDVVFEIDDDPWVALRMINMYEGHTGRIKSIITQNWSQSETLLDIYGYSLDHPSISSVPTLPAAFGVVNQYLTRKAG